MTKTDHDHRQCIELFARMSEYLDNELDEAFCRRIEQHLSHCQPCQVCLATLKRTVSLCRGLQPAQPPEGFSSRLRKVFPSG